MSYYKRVKTSCKRLWIISEDSWEDWVRALIWCDKRVGIMPLIKSMKVISEGLKVGDHQVGCWKINA